MNRQEERLLWLSSYFKDNQFKAVPASEDASFRSYYRVTRADQSFILMDAPPSHEDCKPFLKVLDLLSQANVHVPEVFAADLDQGFLLLSDFGNTLYLDVLNLDSYETLYQAAIDTILQIQSIDSQNKVPAYDESLLQTELSLFQDWFIGKHLGIELSYQQSLVLKNTFELLIDNATEQPQVMVHRDYHSRNLMHTAENSPGVIDFQDAVYGPITYDLASLLKDCYITWNEEIITSLCQYFMSQSKHLQDIEETQFMRWFDLMAAQRHLKAIGIFCRLNYRDGKSGYLNDIPRTMKYLVETAKSYPELYEFSELLADIQPKLIKQS